MKRLLLFNLFFSSLIFFVDSCKKNGNSDNQTTNINGQLFGCKVDGRQFIPDYWDYGNNVPPLHIDFVDDALTHKVKLFVRAERANEQVQIYLKGPLIKGVRNLKFRTLPFPVDGNPADYGIYIVKSPYAEFITNDTVGGFVELIDIDTLTNKVYGKFEFTGTDKVSNQHVKITGGI